MQLRSNEYLINKAYATGTPILTMPIPDRISVASVRERWPRRGMSRSGYRKIELIKGLKVTYSYNPWERWMNLSGIHQNDYIECEQGEDIISQIYSWYGSPERAVRPTLILPANQPTEVFFNEDMINTYRSYGYLQEQILNEFGQVLVSAQTMNSIMNDIRSRADNNQNPWPLAQTMNTRNKFTRKYRELEPIFADSIGKGKSFLITKQS